MWHVKAHPWDPQDQHTAQIQSLPTISYTCYALDYAQQCTRRNRGPDLSRPSSRWHCVPLTKPAPVTALWAAAPSSPRATLLLPQARALAQACRC